MKWFNSEFIRFIFVGGCNTLIYYLLYLCGLHLFHLHYMVAHVVGFILSLVGSYFLNTYVTYRVKPTWRKFFMFPLTQLANTVITTIILLVLVELLQVSSSLAPLFSMFVTVPITFIITGKILK